MSLSVLALEPYYGGSHKSFLDGWSKRSSHTFVTEGLPPYKWTWRMRHSSVTFADTAREKGYKPDVIVTSGMLDVAAFRGLAPRECANAPIVLVMHENQLTYPVPGGGRRDSDAVFKQITSCLASDIIWWNSAFNRDSFIEKLPVYLKRMPDYKLLDVPDRILKKSIVIPLGIPDMTVDDVPDRSADPLVITWAARWEHDKNPEDFFKALKIVKARGIEFRVNVVGEQFSRYPKCFDEAEQAFADEIDAWGYQESFADYKRVLASSDVVVSTADHEFFGMSVLEGALAGAHPVLPDRLAYPEIFNSDNEGEHFFFGSTAEDLAESLIGFAAKKSDGKLIVDDNLKNGQEIAQKYQWDSVAATLDQLLEEATRL